MTGFEVDQGIWEAAIKGLAPSIAKKAIEDIQSIFGDLVDKTGNLTKKGRIKLEPVAKQYATKFYDRHGTLKVLSMPEPIPLDSVYVAVQVLNPDYLRFFESIDGLEDLFRQSRERNFQKKDCEKLPGLTAARNKQYLMVLGAPGGGKSTFLRKVGLEAIKGEKGSYQQPYIPVLLELKNFRNQEINLLEAIAAEFKTCGLPRYEEWTQELLNEGKLLILLDGLDEVSTEQMSDMVTKIQDFVDHYNKNRFIVSCRMAARKNFRRFSDVAVANFDDEQIEGFIKNWFHSKPELAEDCWEKLKSSDYQAAKELAQTPVLLTLICVLYQRSGQFPTNRTTLYERALGVLLEEWNAAKEIPQTQIYKGLDTKRKELMLTEIAYNGFVEDRLFFQKRDLAKQIEKLLAEMLPDEKLIDGHAVLRDIEVQHGILIERAESIYSFSHLTIQEFLTALYLSDDDSAIVEQVVNNHLFDQRWREVFLLLAGLKNNGDALLLALERRIQQLVFETPKLQAILEWVEQVVDPTDGEIKAVGKRAIAIAYVYTYAIYSININVKDDLVVLMYCKAFKIGVSNFKYHSDFNLLAYANALGNANFNVGNIYVNASAELSMRECKEYLDFIEKFSIFNNLRKLEIHLSLSKLKNIIPNENSELSDRIAFQNQLLGTYRDVFDLSPTIVKLTEIELEIIDKYFTANKLLIDCRANAVRVRCWQDIESRMLLPVRPKP